ncbi:carboxylic ester hydrolase [Favolaschia claudopus]|uniref:Carboxylic ester hydrolase n=1 Tax=Favolaschia claudopus TaxID=2862362 RepID=A0AAW0EG12_9AGAR
MRLQSVVAAAITTGVAASNFPHACSSLASRLSIPNTTISSTSFVAAGTNLTFPTLDPSCAPLFQVVSSDVCRVVLDIATSNRSRTVTEVWLPSNWTGRFLATGNGGIGGCIQYYDVDYGASLGFATTGSDGGHSGQNGTLWLNNIDVVIDYSFRSLLASAQVGKQVTDDFYGAAHKKSYYLGCSTGGRQGWKMAQDHPDVFDGIVAGAPVLSFGIQTAFVGMFYPIIATAGPDGFPPPSLWPVIDAEILKQCDGIDGAIDGIIEEPTRCHFRPEALLCSPAKNSSSCLTPKQVDTVRAIFGPLIVDGIPPMSGLAYGPGLVAAIFATFSGPGQFLFTDNWYRFAIFNDPSFNATFLTPEEITFGWNLNPGGVNTWSGDLSHLKNRGSKILHYHGQQDTIVPSANSNRYYELVAKTMNLPHTSIDDFYRFFRISGMGHCATGQGAVSIGNMETNLAGLDPSENVLTAMVRWVEEGIAPDTITGTAFIDQNPASGVDFRRAHCRYPYRNVFTGKGSVKDPGNWKCIL